jgi:hypothetical protein
MALADPASSTVYGWSPQGHLRTDGPYAETKEQLGGYFMIDVPDLDTALTWAARCPGASHGVVEVRPLWPM